MKVEELIDKLRKLPQDVDVILIGYTLYEDDCQLYEGSVKRNRI